MGIKNERNVLKEWYTRYVTYGRNERRSYERWNERR
jgi:hypothetical protein